MYPRPFRVEAVLFDFDGTLSRPGSIDFAGLKEALGSPADSYALEYLTSLPDGSPERERAESIRHRFEIEGAEASEPNDGAEEAVLRLRADGIPLAIVTRNRLDMVERALERFPRISLGDFDAVVTREDPVPFKPDPGQILLAAERLGVAPDRCVMVGDFVVDVEAGHRAGALTVHLLDPEDSEIPDHDPDFRITSLRQLEPILQGGLPLPMGKVPNDLLARALPVPGGDVLIGPGVGQDVAALDVSGAEILVAHPDPITLAGSDLARFTVLVNANDIATSGADPRWFLATVLLPVGSTPSEASCLIRDLAAACAEQGIALVGGHTEVTDAVTRPTIAGTMLGKVVRADLRDKNDARPGDRVILTARVAVEGTAVLAMELGDRLRELGMTPEELTACRAFVERLSVLPAARIARGFAGVRAMHDVTEGGLATGIRELATAAGVGVRVRPRAVPIYPETRRICDLLDADPLGVIGSGSLLIVCAPEESAQLTAALTDGGVEATEIGEIVTGSGVIAERGDWPAFDVDEVARLLGP